MTVAIFFFKRFPRRNRVELLNDSKYQPHFRGCCSIRILLFFREHNFGINISLNGILLAFAYASTRYFVRTRFPNFVYNNKSLDPLRAKKTSFFEHVYKLMCCNIFEVINNANVLLLVNVRRLSKHEWAAQCRRLSWQLPQ